MKVSSILGPMTAPDYSSGARDLSGWAFWACPSTSEKTGVEVRTKESEETWSRYGRIIADVYLPSGHELGQVLVATGYAWWYREYSDDSTLEKLEEAARASGQGLWNKADPIPPWQWRKK